MTVSVFDSDLLGGLLSDSELVALLDDHARLSAMVRFEGALARVQSAVGVIPASAGETLSAFCEGYTPDPATLGPQVAIDGTPVTALLQDMRARLIEAGHAETAGFLHVGSTSQDVVDTALVLQLRLANDRLTDRLAALIALLADLAARHRRTVMAARTRGQIATPTTFGLRVAVWLDAALRRRDALAVLRPDLESLQFGGAAGTLSAFQGRGMETAAKMAAALDLPQPALSWQSQRDRIAGYAHWLTTTGGVTGKIGGELALLAQSEVGEVALAGGASSAMPHKANPIAAETLTALSRFLAGQNAALQPSLMQLSERDGAGWTVEWMTLPAMVVATGRSLSLATETLTTLDVRAGRMRQNLDINGGTALAEAAATALSNHLPRAEAKALVAEASKDAIQTGTPLMDLLRQRTGAPVDWDALANPLNHIGEAEAMIEAVLARV
ncbi:MAG: lyase family protein [Alphaproteobacteria bacterium]|nr:lyase family protein [Alphaproteobacteria bacterium]